MSGGAVLAGLLLGLWPFGGEPPAGGDRVGDLGPGEPPPAGQAAPADPERARLNYARFLAQNPGADPSLVAVATRRLADLTLARAEALDAEGDTAGARALMAEAAGRYREFLTAFPDDPAAARVRYQLARALDLSGRPDESLAVLEALVAAHPDSPLATEARFRRGELLYARRDWPAAAAAYSEVARDGGGDFREQALYKHGWMLFKQGLHEESLVSFFAVLDRYLDDGGAAVDPATLDRASRELVEDSLRAVSLGLTYLEGPASATTWLDGRGRETPYAALVFRRLGELYLEQERYQDAAAASRAYVEWRPLADDAPAMQQRAAEAFAAGGFTAQVLAAKEGFVERFGPGGAWAEAREAAGRPAVPEGLRETLDELASHHHAMARAGEAGAGERAIRWYRAWLAAFPEDPEAAGRQFLLAEALLESGRIAEAAEGFERAAWGWGERPRSAESGYAAVLAWRQAAGEAGADAAMAERVVEVSLRFAGDFPGHPEAGAVLTEAAQDLFDADRMADAARTAAAAIAGLESGPVPDPDRLVRARLILGHASFETGEHAAAEDAYRLVLASGGAPDPAAVEERLAAAVYSQGRTAAERGDTAAAVSHYARVREAAPGSPIAATADYDAAALTLQAGAWAEAAAMLSGFRARYPGHALQDQVTLDLARALGEAGDPAGEAAELEAVSRLGGQPAELRRAALTRAAEAWEQAGEPWRARSALADYVDRFPAPLDPAMEARRRLVELGLAAGDPAAVHRWRRSIVAADAEAGDARTERSRTLAAGAALALAETDRALFDAQVLDAPLAASLPRKKAAMEAALAAYARATEYRVMEVVTEATWRTAEVYRSFARALMDSERPPELDELALEEYEILLEEQAYPFEERAIAIHEANAERARGGVYDEWVVRSFEALAELVPGRYARSETGERFVRHLE